MPRGKDKAIGRTADRVIISSPAYSALMRSWLQWDDQKARAGDADLENDHPYREQRAPRRELAMTPFFGEKKIAYEDR